MDLSLNPQIPKQREQLRRLFIMKRTELEMMVQRGYDISAVTQLQRGYDLTTIAQLQSMREVPYSVDLRPFLDPTLGIVPGKPTSPEGAFFEPMLAYRQQTGIFQSRQDFSAIYYTPGREKHVLVLYLGNEPGKQVSMKDFQIVNDFIGTGKFHHIILVTETGLNPDNLSKVRTRMPGYRFEIFLDQELSFNRTKHAYAPIKIEHIPAKEVSAWTQREEIQAEKLPMILNVDPIAKWFGAGPLDVFQTELLGTTTDTEGYARITRMAPSKM